MKVIKGFFKFVFKSILFLIIAGAVFTFYRQWRNSGERQNAYVSTYWPDTALTRQLPKPDSEKGRISFESDDSFRVYVPTASVSVYTDYVNDCMEKGFTVGYSKIEQSFSAENDAGYMVLISYNKTSKEMEIEIAEPVSSLQNSDGDDSDREAGSTSASDAESSEKETTAEEAGTIDDAANDQTDEAPADISGVDEAQGNEAADEDLVNGMHRDFVEAMDSYREFFHSYCEFMKSYDSTDISMLSQYADFMNKYADYMSKLYAWDQDEMNNAELAYYMQVTADIEKELAEVIQTMN